MKNITRKIKYPTVAVMYMSLFRFNSSAYDKVITIKVITPKTYSNLVEYNYFMVKVIIAMRHTKSTKITLLCLIFYYFLGGQ